MVGQGGQFPIQIFTDQLRYQSEKANFAPQSTTIAHPALGSFQAPEKLTTTIPQDRMRRNERKRRVDGVIQ